MLNVAELFPEKAGINYLGVAIVIYILEQETTLKLRLAAHKDEIETFARLAVPLACPLSLGDEVVVAGEVGGDMYVIGVLTGNEKCRVASGPENIQIGNGAYAIVDGAEEEKNLRLFSKRNELLIEYDSVSESTRINVDSGNLEFTTSDGDIVFDSAKSIRINGHLIEIDGRSGVHLGVIDSIGQFVTSFTLQSGIVRLMSPSILVASKNGRFIIDNMRYAGSRLRSKIDDMNIFVNNLMTVAVSINEKAKNVFRSVEKLAQLKAGRMRTIVDSTVHIKSKKVILKAEEDCKIKAEKIHLG